jgi:hypothetical protein
MNDELEEMWREAIVVCFQLMFWHLCGKIEEDHKGIVKIPNFHNIILTLGPEYKAK